MPETPTLDLRGAEAPGGPAPTADHTASVPAVSEVRVGLALSGGGFRAAAFHLGVLKALEDLGVLPNLRALSCISGGAIAGATYALGCAKNGGAPGSYPVDALIDTLVPVLTSNVRGEALFGSPVRVARLFASLVSRRVSRIGLMVEQLDRALFAGASLSALPDWVVLTATNLRTGKAWKFYHDRMGDYLVGASAATDCVPLAAAVAASAAYPGLTDAYGLSTAWEDLKPELLDAARWQAPQAALTSEANRWRSRYGAPAGRVTFPLMDGGLYDNEGVNGLRGWGITHAILSVAAPPESDVNARAFGLRLAARVVDVMHDRLGAVTRQATYEMTHGAHPNDVASAAASLASELDASAANSPSSAHAALVRRAARTVAGFAAVGEPRRGRQFTASAQVLVKATDLAEDRVCRADGAPFPVAAARRGLDAPLVDALARLRTDLDALDAEQVELLMAQGYAATHAQVRAVMPSVVHAVVEDKERDELAAFWPRARRALEQANAHPEWARSVIEAGYVRALLGRTPRRSDHWRYRVWAFGGLLTATAAALTLVAGVGHVVWIAAAYALSRILGG